MSSPEISPYFQSRVRPLHEVIALRAGDDFKRGLKHDQCPFKTPRLKQLWQDAWLRRAGALSKPEEKNHAA